MCPMQLAGPEAAYTFLYNAHTFILRHRDIEIAKFCNRLKSPLFGLQVASTHNVSPEEWLLVMIAFFVLGRYAILSKITARSTISLLCPVPDLSKLDEYDPPFFVLGRYTAQQPPFLISHISTSPLCVLITCVCSVLDHPPMLDYVCTHHRASCDLDLEALVKQMGEAQLQASRALLALVVPSASELIK